MGRRELPTACSIDSQSVKAADTVGAASRGFDGGKKINGRKRHIAVDTLGLLLAVVVTAASVQDRDGACPLLAMLRERFSTITLVWADGGYARRLVSWRPGCCCSVSPWSNAATTPADSSWCPAAGSSSEPSDG